MPLRSEPETPRAAHLSGRWLLLIPPVVITLTGCAVLGPDQLEVPVGNWFCSSGAEREGPTCWTCAVRSGAVKCGSGQPST